MEILKKFLWVPVVLGIGAAVALLFVNAPYWPQEYPTVAALFVGIGIFGATNAIRHLIIDPRKTIRSSYLSILFVIGFCGWTAWTVFLPQQSNVKQQTPVSQSSGESQQKNETTTVVLPNEGLIGPNIIKFRISLFDNNYSSWIESPMLNAKEIVCVKGFKIALAKVFIPAIDNGKHVLRSIESRDLMAEITVDGRTIGYVPSSAIRAAPDSKIHCQ